MQKKNLFNKTIYELNGQIAMFGRDNLSFKSINMPKKQSFINICNNFKLKKIVKRTNIALSIVNANIV